MSSSSAHPIIKGGYYPSWVQNVDIPTQYFTHIFYAFLNLKDDDDDDDDDDTFQFNIDDDQAALLQTFMDTLQAKSPPVKVLFSVGGGGNEPATAVLSRMASNQESRALFIRSSIEVSKKFGFDGVDLDWEYPKNQTDMENLGHLLKEWRQAVTEEANKSKDPPLLLTAAVYYKTTVNWTDPALDYPVTVMSENLDFINVMNYDYHGSNPEWEPGNTGAHAALHDPAGEVCTASSIESWTGAGVPPGKLIMGLPLYGRTWKLENPTSSGIGARANGEGPGNAGRMTYAAVVRFNQTNNARVVHDEPTGSVYSVAGTDWISYDDEWSVSRKIEFARDQKRLGGHFFWQVTEDHEWTLSKTASDSW